MGSLNWHFTVDQYRAIQHIPLNETGRHADRGGPGDMYSIGIEMGEVRSHNPIVTWNRSAKLTAVLMKQYNIPLRNVVPHYYWTGKNCPAPLLTNGRPASPDLVTSGGSATTTDLLITWLFNITTGATSNYKLAAVIAIMIFVVVAVLSLIVYNVIPSTRNEEDYSQ